MTVQPVGPLLKEQVYAEKPMARYAARCSRLALPSSHGTPFHLDSLVDGVQIVYIGTQESTGIGRVQSLNGCPVLPYDCLADFVQAASIAI